MGITQHIIENDFKRDQTSAYQLSILIGMDSLVYSVYDGDSNKLLLLKHLALPKDLTTVSQQIAAINEVVSKEDFLAPAYKQVRIAFAGIPISLIPGRLFNPDEITTYIDELTPSENGGRPVSDRLESLNIHAVYKLDTKLTDALLQHFPNAHFFNIASAFLIGSHHMIQEGTNTVAFANFGVSSFQLALYSKGELLVFNTFDYQSANDVLYFVLLAFEQYEFDPSEVPFLLSGKIVSDSDIYKMLYRYIAEISFLPAPSFIEVSKKVAAFDPNFYFPLHALVLCEK